MFLTRVGLPEAVTTATKRTRLNGKPLEWNTKNSVVGMGWWELGHEIKKRDANTFTWNTWTVENDKHVVNFRCIITRDGRLVKGTVNLFIRGTMPLNQDYIDALLEEYQHENAKPVWDHVEL